MSKRRALVLGGGGTVGVIWETGVLMTLLEQGIDPGAADLLIGTSAGSIVGVQISNGQLGQPPRTPAPPGGRTPLPEEGLDEVIGAQIMELWGALDLPDEERCRRIGALARDARTVTESRFREALRAWLDCAQWPARDLRISAVDTESGERVLFTAKDVPLEHAVAASIAVPGYSPPIPIGERIYMDGGVYSSTHADLTLEIDPEVVVVLAPLARPGDGTARCALEKVRAELEQLEREDVPAVHALVPDDEDERVFGPDMMANGKLPEVLLSGKRRGAELAAVLNATW